MSLISIKNLTFAHDGSYEDIFTDVSISLDTCWRLGLTGRNGRGKSTFLKLLLGNYEYRGEISASVEFTYFPFPVKDDSMLTLHVLEDICPSAQQWELEREMNLLELSEDVIYRQFCTLSNGERTKAMLAALFLRENSFLLIDEPTNHLDMHAREVVSAYLRRKQGYILVSHDRVFLDGCIDHIMSINRNSIEVQQGNFSSWMENKRRRDSFELGENEKLRRDIDRLEQAAAQTARWSEAVEKSKSVRNSGLRPDKGHIGHMAAKMMKRSLTAQRRREQAIEDKSKLLRDIDKAEQLKLSPMRFHSKTLVRAAQMGFCYGEREALKRISFLIESGDRVAVLGKNGSGKSTLLKLVMSQLEPSSGELYVGAGMVISYLPQDTSKMSGTLREFAEQNKIDESLFKTILRKLDFSRTQFEKHIEEYSDGQRKKVAIARSLCQRAHLYIWDEPLNFIDLLSRMQIEELILQYSPTLLFVEHDRAFVDNVATKIIEI